MVMLAPASAEVFQNEVDTNQLLRHRVDALLSQDFNIDLAFDNQKRVFIHCSQAEQQVKTRLLFTARET
jgi:hypothetical protein